MYVQTNILHRHDVFHYELHREIYTFRSHIHHTIELCILLNGEMEITVNGKSEIAKSGQCILVMPFQEHKYRSEIENEFVLCTFSPSLISEFMKNTEGLLGEKSVFDLSDVTFETFKRKILYGENFSNYNVKGCLYLILDDYTRQVKMVNGMVNGDVLDRLVYYMSKNYSKPCPLSEVSRAIGYNQVYLSDCIKSSFGINYCSFLNSMRIEHAKYLLGETTQSVLEIALDCGFNDIRSFQRNFKKIVGTTPTNYRNTAKNNPNIEPITHVFPKKYFDELVLSNKE